MGGDIGGHADSNTKSAIKKKIRNCRGKHHRLLAGAVVVVAEINCVFFNIAQNLHGDFGHSRFGVSLRGRSITVD